MSGLFSEVDPFCFFSILLAKLWAMALASAISLAGSAFRSGILFFVLRVQTRASLRRIVADSTNGSSWVRRWTSGSSPFLSMPGVCSNRSRAVRGPFIAPRFPGPLPHPLLELHRRLEQGLALIANAASLDTCVVM